jgi:hypothetical protein
MSELKLHSWVAVVSTLTCLLWPAIVTAADVEKSVPKINYVVPWIERPWEWRYIMVISPVWGIYRKWADEHNKQIGPHALELAWESYFEVTHFFPSITKWTGPDSGISVIVIEFDEDGKVTTPNAFGKPLQGRIDQIMRVTLAEGDPGVNRQFNLGRWFLGLGDSSTHWAPSICSVTEIPSPFSKTDTNYLYGPKFEIGSAHPTVGCREWAYQIKDPGRPYIDVTSYTPKRFDHFGFGTYIQETIGWAGFEDHKPIIGKQDNDWYCLHDCPGDDQPGIIPNIKAWASRNGWKPPQPPTRVPVFPDPPAKSGYYP